MTTLIWLIGLLTSIGMLGIIVALVSDENRRHIAFRRASPLRVWRPRRRVVVVERHIVPERIVR
jgi:hypothetical protein